MSEQQESKKGNPPWKEDATSFLVVFSILAATSGLILALILQDMDKFGSHVWFSIGLLAISLWLFISTGERITDALDENDVEKYVSLLLLYNIAVICLFSGTFFAIYFRGHVGTLIFQDCLILRIFICSAILLLINWRWIIHIKWLISINHTEYNSYIEELKGEKKPEFDRGCWFNLFTWLRNLLSKKK